jgi:hypothetical protein
MNCNCPLWAQGRLHGKRFRRSLSTRSRSKAREKISTLLGLKSDAVADKPTPDPPAIPQALADHLEFVERNRRLRKSTITSYGETFKPFAAFADERRLRTVEQLSLAFFEQYQAARLVTPKTLEKEFKQAAAKGNSRARVTMPDVWLPGWVPWRALPTCTRTDFAIPGG